MIAIRDQERLQEIKNRTTREDFGDSDRNWLISMVEQLMMSPKEDEIIRQALDVFIRTHLLQMRTAMEPSMLHVASRHDVGREKIQAVNTLLEAAQALLTGSPNGGPGIFSPDISNQARLAWRILSKLNGDTLRVSMVSPEGEPT